MARVDGAAAVGRPLRHRRGAARSSSSTGAAGASSTTAGAASVAVPTCRSPRRMAVRTGAHRRANGGGARSGLSEAPGARRYGERDAATTRHGWTPRTRPRWSGPGRCLPGRTGRRRHRPDRAAEPRRSTRSSTNCSTGPVPRRPGELPDGPFKGVPLLLKDLGAELAGTPFCEGTAFAGDYHSTVDQELTKRFLAAGFVVCGKTNTPEFGILPTTEPKRFGPSRNPWNTAHSTGGSSGGSAAAVASGMVAGGACQRRRRLHPDPGLVLRPGRPQADPGPGLHGAAVRRHDGRAGGRARGDALGPRLGRHSRRRRRPGPRRSLLGAAAARPVVRRCRRARSRRGCGSPS